MSKIDDKNWIEKQFISSQVFHQTLGGHGQETTAGEQFKPRILESFDPVTQESYRHKFLQQSTSHMSKNPPVNQTAAPLSEGTPVAEHEERRQDSGASWETRCAARWTSGNIDQRSAVKIAA
jgi:hypothetical protein